MNNTFLNLTQREADVAVRPTNRPPDNLIGRPVGSIQTAIYASADYLRKAARRGVKRTDWAALDWIAPDESLGHLAQARWLTATIPAERVGMRVDSLLGMVDAVKHGCGLGMLLCVLAERERDLVRLAPPDAGLDTRVFVLTHRDLRKVQRIKALTDHLYDKLRKNRFLIQSRV